LAYDKIACAQFVSTLSDEFVKRAFQMERIRRAIERGKAIKLIQENNFQHKKENNLNFEKKQGNDFTKKEKSQTEEKNGREKGTKLMEIN